MRIIRSLSVRSLLLTGACALALGAPAIAGNVQPRIKSPQLERPPPAGEPRREEPARQERPVPEQEAKPPGGPAPEKPELDQERSRPSAPEEEFAPGQAAPGEEEAKGDFVNRQAVDAVVEMSERLADMNSFRVSAEIAWEEVLENGEKILSLEHVQADVARPHGLRMERSSPGRERIFYYNGDNAVLWGPVTRYYAAVPFKGTLAELAAHLAENYAYEVPLADLFMWGDPEQIKRIEAANFIGQDRIGERICDHYAFRQQNVDWQIWIDTTETGLPCRYAIVDLSDPARPLFQATLEIEPEAAFYDKRFTFDPPEDAAEIPLVTTRPEVKDSPPADEAEPTDKSETNGARPGDGESPRNGDRKKKE